MKLLVATAFLLFIFAEAHHASEHTLRGPRFAVGKVQVYDVEFNVTSGVQGLSNQVSKLAFKAELHIYAKTEKEHFLKITKVYTSGSVKAVESKNADVPMQKNRDLESRLSIPIKFTLENGEVTSYTLSPRESLESKKIKKGILRSLEMYVPESALQQMESSKPNLKIPVMYNVTKNGTGTDQHTTQYLITVSPNAEFPYSKMVYNISRTESFDGGRSLSHKFHHNFRHQGCSSPCKEWKRTGRCPGLESHESPVKAYVLQDHHLVLEEGVMSPEMIKTIEVHNAKMYDQDMKVLFRQRIRKIGYSRNIIEEPTEQMSYTDLQDQEVEINEDEIDNKCETTNPRETVKRLFEEIARTIVSGELESVESTIVGEKIVLLRRLLSKLKVSDLNELANGIVRKDSLKVAVDEEKVRRQIWMDMLPLIGTNESVTFIVSYIKENIDKELLIWEAKEILEALPHNIHLPSEKMLKELRTLLLLPEAKRNQLLFSATYVCLARVIRSVCSESKLEILNGEQVQRSSPFESNGYFNRNSQQASRENSYSHPRCPTELVTEILKDMIQKLANTTEHHEIIIYLDTLSQIGASDVLPVISEYANGTAENIQNLSPSHIEFVKSSAIYSLHSVVSKFPEDVLKIVMPLYFNGTESPKIRTAAFGVLIRSQPSLALLERIVSHSWHEKSNEVGSFVTSTMETFGNSTLPCMQIIARHIKQVMPLIKRFDIGVQHAKNLFWSYFDDIRMFGLKSHLTYTPNNSSIIPSAIYHALSYSTHGLVDTLFEGSLNVQGLSQEKIFQYIDEHILGMPSMETIPKSKERGIFEEAKIVERIPENLRFTLYKRLFYSSSFYYFDSSNLKMSIKTLTDYLSSYLKKSSSDYSGHFVKVLLPSSFRTVTIAKSLPYPVEFQMDHPMVLALKIESRERNPSLNNLNFFIRPSIYLTKLLTHQVKNVGDCKEIGAYHEHKLAISYPVEVKLRLDFFRNVTVRYKLPQLPKNVLYYFTESGTYAEKNDLDITSFSKDRKAIRTLPSPFKNSTIVHLVGLPPVHVECHTEERDLLVNELPTNRWEVLDYTVKRILNAGWRYKSVNISLGDNSRIWPKNTEVTFTIQYSRSHFAKKNPRISRQDSATSSIKDQNIFRSSEWVSSEERENWKTEDTEQQEVWETEPNDESVREEASAQQWFWNRAKKEDYEDNKWAKELKVIDIITRNRKPSTFADEGKKFSNILSYYLSHITHVFNVHVETRPVYSFANVRVEYNHTHSKSLHVMHMDATMKSPNKRVVKQMSMDHMMAFAETPDEFQYNTFSDAQTGLFITALRFHNAGCSCPWKDMKVAAMGVLKHESLDNILNNELVHEVEHKYFLPKHHEQCLEDIKNGHSQSASCVKAIEERSIYNKLKMSILWNQNVPESVRNIARRFDTFMKYFYYPHMSIDYHPNTENRIYINLNLVNKLTAEPFFGVSIKKPEETLTLHRLRTGGLTLSSIHDMLSLNMMKLTNNTYPPTCVMMENSIRTYDSKYYPLSLDGCSYILSTHCTEQKNFAIITKILSTDGTKEVHIHIGPHSLILSPMSGNHYSVKFNDQDFTINEAIIMDAAAEIYVFSETYASADRHLEVVARKAGIRVHYDGKNVKIQIDPRYKGQTCGLCSEFDGETMREFTGIDKCLYSHPSDFVNSAITNKNTCTKQMSYPYICENNMVWTQGSNTAKYAPSIKRNIITVRGSDICFSVRAVPVCDSDTEPTETETLPIGFHCLPKQDITAKRMVSEAKRRSLGEIENKSVDYEENVEVAKMC